MFFHWLLLYCFGFLFLECSCRLPIRGRPSIRKTSAFALTSVKQHQNIPNLSAENLYDQFSYSSVPLKNTLKLVISGAPASGKGTQSELLRAKYNLVHISTGDLLRNAVRDRTPLGLKVMKYMNNAQLVPDAVITEVVCNRLRQRDCIERGWLLDGFPRTEAQALALSAAGLTPDCYVLLDVPQQFMVDRITGRRLDPLTGKIYHLRNNPPPNAAVVERLVQRDDDTVEKIVRRYGDFAQHIQGIKDHYRHILLEVDGSKSTLQIHQSIAGMVDYIKAVKECSVEMW